MPGVVIQLPPCAPAAAGARLLPRLRVGLVFVSASSAPPREKPAGRDGADFCCALGALSCAKARLAASGDQVAQGPMREFLGEDQIVSGLDFARCATGRCAKNNDIANLRYSGEANCAARDPRNSTPLKSETLGISRPERWPPPSFVAHPAPQKSSGTSSFVGKSRPQRARRQNSDFFRRPKLQTAPRMWTFDRAISNQRLAISQTSTAHEAVFTTECTEDTEDEGRDKHRN